jgi:hypothetical protein
MFKNKEVEWGITRNDNVFSCQGKASTSPRTFVGGNEDKKRGFLDKVYRGEMMKQMSMKMIKTNKYKDNMFNERYVKKIMRLVGKIKKIYQECYLRHSPSKS